MKKISMLLLALLMAALLTPAMAITLPEELETIESSAFEGDAGLTGRLILPDSVKTVGSRAFAGTGLHALAFPAGCESVAADVLADANAAYVVFQGTGTAISGTAMSGVDYVFGAAGSTASALSGFYDIDTINTVSGLVYSVTEEEALPLCAEDAGSLSGEVTLPKLVGGAPLRTLDQLVLTGCPSTLSFRVPAYLTIPEGLNAVPYETMFLSDVTCSVTETSAGKPITWATEITGAYGDVSYIWTFTVDVAAYSIITAEPTVTFMPPLEGQCSVTVVAIDAVGDRASAVSQAITVGPAVPVYRALLVGNTYEGTDNVLSGCDVDIASMKTMLSTMTGMPYAVTTRLNITADEMKGSIASTFAGASLYDVSLIYFSGHGTSSGALVGVGNSILNVSDLRSLLDTIPGTKVIIVDACYSGKMIAKSAGSLSPSAFNSAFISGFSSYKKSDDNLAANGYIVMTSCTSQQYSQSLSDGTIAFGAFTYGVCYGSGYDEWNQRALGNLPADTDGNGAITLGEAYSMANDRVDWLATLASGISQSAQYFGDTSFVLWRK